MPTGKEIMAARLLAERKAELEKTLKKDKKYIVVVTHKFEGKFSHFEYHNDEPYAIFVQEGRTDRGSIPQRRVKVSQIVSTGLRKN